MCIYIVLIFVLVPYTLLLVDSITTQCPRPVLLSGSSKISTTLPVLALTIEEPKEAGISIPAWNLLS